MPRVDFSSTATTRAIDLAYDILEGHQFLGCLRGEMAINQAERELAQLEDELEKLDPELYKRTMGMLLKVYIRD